MIGRHKVRRHAFNQQVDQRGAVDSHALKWLTPREGEQALDERLGALVAQPSTVRHVELADYGREQVGQVVRHSARELAHRLHRPALPKLLLGRYLRREVRLDPMRGTTRP